MVGSLRANSGTIERWCKGSAMEYFDPDCLSTPDANIFMEVTVSPTGVPSCKFLDSDCAPVDEFYCEQAVWESAPAIPEWAPHFNGTYFVCHFQRIPDQEISYTHWKQLFARKDNESVSMHFIPATIASRCVFGQRDIDIPENIVKIHKDQLKSPALNSFRLDWVNFVQQHPAMTKDDVMKKASQLREKYRLLFVQKKERGGR